MQRTSEASSVPVIIIITNRDQLRTASTTVSTPYSFLATEPDETRHLAITPRI
jgi:hypothetical protein